MKKVIVLVLLLMSFVSQAFATASITINNVTPKLVKENILANLTVKGHNFRVESVNEYSMVLLYINTVDIGLFGSGTQESRVTYNLIPSGDNIILAVGEVVTTINNQTGARQTYPVGNAITELGFLQEIKAYFNGRYLYGYNSNGEKSKNGYIITEVRPGSAFAEAGIKVGDIIIAINKALVKDNKEKFMVGIIPDKFNPNPTEFVIRQGEVEKTFLLTPKFFPAEYNALNNKNVENLIAPDQAYQVVRNYENGDKYEGEIVSGLLQGKGKYTWANGDVYEGDFVNNLMQGKGKLIYANGSVYEGDFIKGKYDGWGKLTAVDGKIKEGKFKEGIYIDEPKAA